MVWNIVFQTIPVYYDMYDFMGMKRNKSIR